MVDRVVRYQRCWIVAAVSDDLAARRVRRGTAVQDQVLMAAAVRTQTCLRRTNDGQEEPHERSRSEAPACLADHGHWMFCGCSDEEVGRLLNHASAGRSVPGLGQQLGQCVSVLGSLHLQADHLD